MKLNITKITIFIFLIIQCSDLFSQIKLNTTDEIFTIGKNTFLYEDKTSKLEISQISSESFNKFSICKLDVPNFAYTSASIWCKIIIENHTQLSTWFLEIGNPVLDTVFLFSPLSNGKFESKLLSYYINFNKREIETSNFYYKLDIPPQTSKTYFLKVRSEKAVNFPLKIIPENQFIEYNHSFDLAMGIYYGLMLIMVLYNLFIYFSVREKNYLYYVLYVLFMGFMNADLKGTAFEYLWPNLPQINPYLPILSIFTCVFAMLFVNSFLELKKNTKKIIYRITFFIQLLNVIATVLTLCKLTSLAVTIILYTVLFSSVYSLSIGLHLFFKKYKPAKFFVIAWIWLFSGVIIYILLDLGVVPYNYFTANAVLMGSSLEIVFLALALAHKIKILEKESAKAQAETLVSIKENEKLVLEQNLLLEKKVSERTNEIELQKKELLEQSVNLRDANNLLNERNEEINQQNEEIQTIADNLQIQNERVSQMNNELSSINKEVLIKSRKITDSIEYALKIQKATIPNFELVTQLLPNHLIIYKPRDIVSGDFYFLKQIKNVTIIAVADSTGHGVPGAFLSMLGIALLNEIVRNSEIKISSQVLNELRKQIKSSLQQTGEKGEQQDGMDIAFCAINNETLEMSFAGAHNPCWIFRSNEVENKNNEQNNGNAQSSTLITLEADHQPVGIFTKEHPFTEHTFQLKENDLIYLFTDGFQSQFGGVKNEKFKTHRFKELLTRICNLPMSEQKQIIENNFNEWKGDLEQTDDVLIVGVKI